MRLAGSLKLAALELKGRQLLLLIKKQKLETGESFQQRSSFSAASISNAESKQVSP